MCIAQSTGLSSAYYAGYRAKECVFQRVEGLVLLRAKECAFEGSRASIAQCLGVCIA